MWVNTKGYERNSRLRHVLPGLPPEYFQLAASSGHVGSKTLEKGFVVYRLFRTLIERHHGPIDECAALLDFGCGWGRILRFFLKDMASEKLWGIDMWDLQVELAKQTNPYCNFLHVAKDPPTALHDETFDVVVSFSVFSHISEASHKQWLAEFKRILRPGGIFIVTTWGRERTDFFESVRTGSSSAWDEHYNQSMARSFPGREKWLAAYDSGQFCHVDLDYAGNSDYGETCIPNSYVSREWSKSFTILDYIEDRSVCTQNVVVARKEPQSVG